MSTHEQYIAAVRDAALEYACTAGNITEEECEALRNTKMVYGLGNGTYRGVCVYGVWEGGRNFIEIAASGEESAVQVAGTTIHELAHALAGHGAGHMKDWKAACAKLGLRSAKVGQRYVWASIHPSIRHRVYDFLMQDGAPLFAGTGYSKPNPGCSAGIGTRGGTSRGKGTGSRLRLWECECSKPVKVRVASDEFDARCNECMSDFHLVQKGGK